MKILITGHFHCQQAKPALMKALFTSHANPKYFLFHPSHQIFERMHEVLNVGKKITNCIVCL
jgi:HEPN domain-containing protein